MQGYVDMGLRKFWGHKFDLLRSCTHVTSSVTWPLDSAYVVSYWWSIVTICIYLAPLRRYEAPKLLESRPWPFGVTWRHRSRDHRTRRRHFRIGGQWWPCVYLARIRRYGASKILRSRVWPLRSRDVIGHVTIRLGTCGFLLVVRCNQASILHRYGDIKPQSCICPC